jgi:hypothetical protein
MAGYAARLLHITFPELSEDPNADPIYVGMRNPKVMPMDQIQPSGEEVTVGPDGQVVPPKSAKDSMYEIIAKLVVSWRVYDATHMELDPTSGQPTDQPLLPLPATPDLVRRLPGAIVNRLAEEVVGALNPQ